MQKLSNTELDEYELLLASTQELIGAYWPASEPLLQRCINKNLKEEATTDDILKRLIGGSAFMFVAKKDTVDGPDVRLVLIAELCQYPRLPAMNILAVAGSDLDFFRRKYWKAFCGWAFVNGARAFEGIIPPALERLVKELGFEKPAAHIHVRLKLTGE